MWYISKNVASLFHMSRMDFPRLLGMITIYIPVLPNNPSANCHLFKLNSMNSSHISDPK